MTGKFVKYTFYCSPPKISLERLKLETLILVCMLIVASKYQPLDDKLFLKGA